MINVSRIQIITENFFGMLKMETGCRHVSKRNKRNGIYENFLVTITGTKINAAHYRLLRSNWQTCTDSVISGC